MHTRHIDVTPAWEPACHDRQKRGTTDGACRILARLNHACDRLADLAAATGRSHDMDFYQTFKPTPDTSHYFTSGGAALLNDPYAEVGKCAAAVGANAVLQHELSVPKEQRKQCTRFLRLAAQDDVDATRTEVLWKSLPTPLHEEAVRSMLGRGGLTSKDLSRIPHCEGAKFIKNVMASAGCDDCPFCPEGRESRYHW